ncbi:MAG: hypothetical protein ACLRQP_02005 [Bacteroides caccae]|nr:MULTISPECIES: hypothetical protein [Bacteroides]MCZ2726690.1 hypothetical protein [Bacteroides caccae]
MFAIRSTERIGGVEKMFIDIVDTRDMDEHTGGRKRKVQDDR